MFTHLERAKKTHGVVDLTKIICYNSFHDGLPQLLSYKLKQEGGEILMADAGVSIDKWEHDL